MTGSLDYEGELGIIVAKAGRMIGRKEAWSFVCTTGGRVLRADHAGGAVIVNDVTARERQRDHKQFYIGKSLDTFAPMCVGPCAIRQAS